MTEWWFENESKDSMEIYLRHNCHKPPPGSIYMIRKESGWRCSHCDCNKPIPEEYVVQWKLLMDGLL